MLGRAGRWFVFGALSLISVGLVAQQPEAQASAEQASSTVESTESQKPPTPGPEPATAEQQPLTEEQQEAAEAQRFRVEVREVVVPVTVTDERGRFVTGLTKEDFRIFDEGVEQEIVYFSPAQGQPIVIGFLLDLSNRSRIHWKRYQEAAMELVWALMPGEEQYKGYLIGYSTEAELLVDTTHDYNPIVDKIRELKPAGGAALFDAIYLACTQRTILEGEPTQPRHVLIIIGDGHDNASVHTLDEVLELAQRKMVTIYGVSTVAYGFDAEGDENLRLLAEETGGRVEYPLENIYKDVAGYLSKPQDAGNYALTVGTGEYASHVASSIFNSVAAITGEITTQYILRFRPSYQVSSKPFRRIEVVVRLPNVKVRARKGYYVSP